MALPPPLVSHYSPWTLSCLLQPVISSLQPLLHNGGYLIKNGCWFGTTHLCFSDASLMHPFLQLLKTGKEYFSLCPLQEETRLVNFMVWKGDIFYLPGISFPFSLPVSTWLVSVYYIWDLFSN